MKPFPLMPALHVQIEHRADGRGGRDLDGAPVLAAQLAGINLAGIALLHELAVPPAGDRAEDHDHVLET